MVVTLVVVAVKVAEVAPAATVTDAGTDTAVLLSERATALPPAGAAWFRVTVQVLEVPAGILVGEHASALMVGDDTVPAVVMPPPLVAIVTLPPDDEAPSEFVRFNVVALTVGASVTETVAPVPFAMLLVSIPAATQV